VPATEEKRKRLRYLQLKKKKAMLEQEGKLKATSLVDDKDIDVKELISQTSDILNKTKLGKVAENVEGFSAGLVEGGTLGLSRFIPPLKKASEQAKEKTPEAFASGEIASFFAPGTGQAKVFKGATKLAGKLAAPKIVKKGVEGLAGGAITEGVRGFSEEGDVLEGVKKGASGALTGAATGAGLTQLGGGLKRIGQSITRKAFGKQAKSFKDLGFNPDDINELDLGGTIKQTIKKSQTKLDELSKNIDDIASRNIPNARFNIVNDVAKSSKQIADVAETRANEKAVQNAINRFTESFKKRGETAKELTLDEYRKIKTEIGKIAFRKTKDLAPVEAARTQAAKLIYYNMMDNMAEQVPEIVPVNKLMHRVLNINTAAKDAEEIASNKNASLFAQLTTLGFGAGAIGAGLAGNRELATGLALLGGAERLARTPRGGSSLFKAGKGIGSMGAIRGVSGMTGKIEPKEETKEITPEQIRSFSSLKLF